MNDILIIGNHLHDVNELKFMLGREFDIKDMDPTKKILGMQIHQDRRSKKLWLSQQVYVAMCWTGFA